MTEIELRIGQYVAIARGHHTYSMLRRDWEAAQIVANLRDKEQHPKVFGLLNRIHRHIMAAGVKNAPVPIGAWRRARTNGIQTP